MIRGNVILPTILREGPYRFFFYSGDRNEPVHIHVERQNSIAKFWLAPVRLAWSAGYNRVEILKIHKIIEKNYDLIVEAWNEYFGD
jgi:hypothetical protein